MLNYKNKSKNAGYNLGRKRALNPRHIPRLEVRENSFLRTRTIGRKNAIFTFAAPEIGPENDKNGLDAS